MSSKSVGETFNALTDAQQKLVLSGDLLTEQQKRIIVENTNLSMSEAGVITNTEGIVLSENKATTSTFSLSSAFKGLAASLGITTTALGIITGALATVAVGAIAYKKWAEYQEELRQSAYDTAIALDEQNKSVDGYVERYKELRTALQNAKGDEEATYAIKQDLLTLQNELNDAFGEEYGKLNLVTDAYKDQTEAIKEYNKELAQSYLNENDKAIRTATNKMEGENHYNLSLTGEILNSDRGKIIKEIADSYSDRGVTLLDELGDGSYSQFSIHLDADAEDAYATISDFMNDVRQKAIELDNEDLFADILEISSNSLNQSKSIIDEYGEIYRKALLSEIAVDSDLSTGYNQITKAVEDYNEAILKSEDPYNDDNVKNAWNNLQTVKKGIEENTDEWGKYESVTSEAFKQANVSAYSFYQLMQNDDSISKLTNDLKGLSDTDLKSMADDDVQDSFDKLCQSANDYGLEVQDVIDLLVKLGIVQGQIADDFSNSDEFAIPIGISETVDALNTKLKPTMDSLADAWRNVFDDDGNFVQDNVNLDMFSSIKSELDSLNEEFGISVDGYEDLIKTLTDTETGTAEAKNAFDDFATSLFYGVTASGMFNDETKDTIVQMIESLGITNALEIANRQLAITEEGVVLAEQTKADAMSLLTETDRERIAITQSKIQAYLLEAGATDVARLATFQLIAAEQIFGNTDLNCSQKIQELNKLASAYLTTAQSARLAAYTKGLEKSGLSSEEVVAKSQAYINQMETESVKIDVDYDGLVADAGKAGKDSSDAYLEAFEKELDELKTLRDRGEISEKSYLDRLRNLYTKFFKDKAKYAKEYEKYRYEYLDGMRSMYQKLFSYISDMIGDHISELQDERDSIIEGYEEERDAVEERYQNEIDLIDEKIKKIEDAAKARERELSLMQKLYNFMRSMTQRTQRKMVDGQLVYTPDPESSREAKTEYNDQKREIQISKLEKKKESYEKKIEDSNKYYDKLIENTNKYYDNLISQLEAYQKKWDDMAEWEEHAEMIALVRELGYSEQDFLNMSEDAFNTFSTNYLGILKDIYGDNEGMLNALSDVTGRNMDEIQGYLGATVDEFKDLSSSIEDVGDSMKKLGEDLEGIASDENMGKIKTCGEILNEFIQKAREAEERMKSARETSEEIYGSGKNPYQGTYNSQTGEAYASGTNGKRLSTNVPNALIAEEAPELVCNPETGKYQIFTKPTVTDLDKNSIVFNGAETEQILKREDADDWITIKPWSVDDMVFNKSFDYSNFVASRLNVPHITQPNYSNMVVNNNNNQSQPIVINIDASNSGDRANGQLIANEVTRALHKELGGIKTEAYYSTINNRGKRRF